MNSWAIDLSIIFHSINQRPVLKITFTGLLFVNDCVTTKSIYLPVKNKNNEADKWILDVSSKVLNLQQGYHFHIEGFINIFNINGWFIVCIYCKIFSLTFQVI